MLTTVPRRTRRALVELAAEDARPRAHVVEALLTLAPAAAAGGAGDGREVARASAAVVALRGEADVFAAVSAVERHSDGRSLCVSVRHAGVFAAAAVACVELRAGPLHADAQCWAVDRGALLVRCAPLRPGVAAAIAGAGGRVAAAVTVRDGDGAELFAAAEAEFAVTAMRAADEAATPMVFAAVEEVVFEQVAPS
jgi:hypothetical protein